MSQPVSILNKKAYFHYEILDKFVAGIMLTGTEIKSVRESKVNIGEAYCVFKNDELWVKNMHISEYSKGTHYNHEPLRERKLLVTKRELKKLLSNVKEKGYAIIPLKMFISGRGFAKLEIALARGKKVFDKRESIKKRDVEREHQRDVRLKM